MAKTHDLLTTQVDLRPVPFSCGWTPGVIAKVIESGFTFFLFQKGQLPVPFERLGYDENQQNLGLSGPSEEKRSKNPSTSTAMGQPGQPQQRLAFTILEEGGDVVPDPTPIMSSKSQDQHNRLMEMIRVNRKAQLEKRSLKSQLGLIKKEIEARKTLESSFAILEDVIGRISSSLCAIVLTFGITVYTPKEIIIFDLTETEMHVSSDCNNRMECESTFSEVTTTILKNFAKALIMSEEVTDFTEKPLLSTLSHLCFITTRQLESDERKGLQFLDKYNFGLLRENPSACKRLLIQCCNVNSKKRTSNNDEPTVEIDENRFLFHNNSSRCYQIPMRFRGFQCKNKQF